jgi:hypothetical protein
VNGRFERRKRRLNAPTGSMFTAVNFADRTGFHVEMSQAFHCAGKPHFSARIADLRVQ